MTIPSAVLIFILIIISAGSLTLAAFIWAIRTKQFLFHQMNEGARSVFDDDEPEGYLQDMIFATKHERNITIKK
jgi:nitrogen fixation-related uncharacterized protein